MFDTHGLGLVPCFGQEPASLALTWLTLVMAIMSLQDDVTGIAPPLLAIYT